MPNMHFALPHEPVFSLEIFTNTCVILKASRRCKLAIKLLSCGSEVESPTGVAGRSTQLIL